VTVTPPKPKDELALTAAHLSRAAPSSWADFMKAFEAYTAERKDSCVQAPADRVLLAQGRAQQCVELSSLFTTAIAATQK